MYPPAERASAAAPTGKRSGVAVHGDPVFDHIAAEFYRQQRQIELIASENIVSQAVLRAQGSVLTNKYAEGYPGRRYYGGCEHVDALAIERARQLFDCRHANVQPHSGAQANAAVYLALLKPGDKTLGMSLAHGGHLTHGAAVSLSGKWFQAHHYGVRRDDARIDLDQVRELARSICPRLLIAGGSSYPRVIDFQALRGIADECGALFMVDMAHFAGLVAAGCHPSPFPHAHIITSTTHKTLRGPRGGLVLTNDQQLASKIDAAVFPGLQGGPLMHVIAGKAVAFGEASTSGFHRYARQVIDNALVLSATLLKGGLDLVSGGTDTHLVLVDLRSWGLTGREAEAALERAGLTCNKSAVPYDPQKPAVTSGVRLGTPAGTSRGFGAAEFQRIGGLVLAVFGGLARHGAAGNCAVERVVADEVVELCSAYPIYSNL